MNFYTAKRLCSALVATLQRIEASFGPIELDVQRRSRAQCKAARNNCRQSPSAASAP